MQFKLFDDQPQLRLPQHLMEYTPHFIDAKEANELLNLFLRTVPWEQHKVIMYDKEVITPRLSAWFGERPIRENDVRSPRPMTAELEVLRQRIMTATGSRFDGVLLNYYRDGNDSVAWHSDKDTVPGIKTDIASVSIGQERNFDFRSKENHNQRYSIALGHGSLLLMKADLQKYWEHRIAKSVVPMSARINLTFRKTFI
nr:alpha-ketoglutarate-dependent dioxygenase AlkB [uncultured Dyadobacter sp.]